MADAAELKIIGIDPFISRSVGRGGTNRAIDVAIVQKMINAYTSKTRGEWGVLENGVYDAAIAVEIEAFQRSVLKMKHADGQLSPHGKTIKALNGYSPPDFLPNILSQEENFSLWTQMDVARFVKLYGEQFGKEAAKQAAGLASLFQKILLDPDIYDIRWGAYMLATIKHETGHTFLPIEEDEALWRQHAGPGQYAEEQTVTVAPGRTVKNRYYGRGYVQLTLRENYLKMGRNLGRGHDFEYNPALVLDADTAYQIASLGMRNGHFIKGHSLYRHLHGSHKSYYEARNIINTKYDAADIIERYAITFESLMLLSTV